MSEIRGTVYSHTIIRVPGAAHSGQAPFVVILVDTDGDRRVLGRLETGAAPAIGMRVTTERNGSAAPVFRPCEEE